MGLVELEESTVWDKVHRHFSYGGNANSKLNTRYCSLSCSYVFIRTLNCLSVWVVTVSFEKMYTLGNMHMCIVVVNAHTSRVQDPCTCTGTDAIGNLHFVLLI